MSNCPQALLRSRLNAAISQFPPCRSSASDSRFGRVTAISATRRATSWLNADTVGGSDCGTNEVVLQKSAQDDELYSIRPDDSSSSTWKPGAGRDIWTNNEELSTFDDSYKTVQKGFSDPLVAQDENVPSVSTGHDAVRPASYSSSLRASGRDIGRGRLKRKVFPVAIASNNKDFLQNRQTRYPGIAPKLGISENDAKVSPLYSEFQEQQWKVSFAQFSNAKRLGEPYTGVSSIPKLEAEGLELFESILADCNGEFRRAWKDLPRESKARLWQPIVMKILREHPDRALEFLVVTTLEKDQPNSSMVSACFSYLLGFHYTNRFRNDPGYEAYISALEVCLRPETWTAGNIPPSVIHTFVFRARRDAIIDAFNKVRRFRLSLPAPTLLCFMRAFTRLGDMGRALEALRMVNYLRDPKFSLKSVAVMRHCCSLLTLDTVVDIDGQRNFRVLPRLLEIGVRPNRDMMNVVLSNALKTGDRQLGLDMLRFMTHRKFQLDGYTYLTLLTYAVAREDRELVDALLQEIEAREDLKRNSFIQCKVFHAKYVFSVKRMDRDSNPSELFYSMLDLYNQFYDIAPLKELYIIPPHYAPPNAGAQSPPPPMALYTIVATYLKCNRPTQKIIDIYRRFRYLVVTGHPSIAPLAETDHTYNEFMVAFRNHPSTVGMCVHVIEDMLGSHAEASNGLGKDRSHQTPQNCLINHVKPTTLTWNILLSSFLFYKKYRPAEKVRQIMARHGVKYDTSTWNLIISGYAKLQMVDETARAIKSMEEDGFKMNHRTLNGLNRLRDTDRLWTAMDELDARAEKLQGKRALAGPEPLKTTSLELPQDDHVEQSTDHQQSSGDQKTDDDLLDRALSRLRQPKTADPPRDSQG